MTRAALAAALIGALGLGCLTAGEGQPHMQAALGHLRAARAELERAPARKGGHRARAIALVDRAIVQVERGIAFDAMH